MYILILLSRVLISLFLPIVLLYIGQQKRAWLLKGGRSAAEVEMMIGLKNLFDPRHILNPGKEKGQAYMSVDEVSYIRPFCA